MWSMRSFTDEYTKIAASRESAKSPKTRIGKRPIRAHNLLKKAAPVPEVAAATAGGLKGLLSRVWASKALKPAALVGSGAVAGKVGEETLVEPWQYGRRAQSMGAQL